MFKDLSFNLIWLQASLIKYLNSLFKLDHIPIHLTLQPPKKWRHPRRRKKESHAVQVIVSCIIYLIPESISIFPNAWYIHDGWLTPARNSSLVFARNIRWRYVFSHRRGSHTPADGLPSFPAKFKQNNKRAIFIEYIRTGWHRWWSHHMTVLNRILQRRLYSLPYLTCLSQWQKFK